MKYTILFACVFMSFSFALQQVETEHYYVVFKKGDEFWANKVIAIAEDVWDDLVTAYDVIEDFSKITIYIEDDGDYANGAAYTGHNAVHIYTTHNNWRSRGGDRWIRNVLAHELSHIYTCKSATKDGFFRYFHIDRISSYANPDVNASVWWSDLLAPIWWIEGVAQLESSNNKGDHWDNYRDMFLRMATLEDDLLNHVQMATFNNKNGFYPEMTYNQGFALMRYIKETYGSEATHTIGKTKAFPHFNIALRKATGKTGKKLYDEWKIYLNKKYGSVEKKIKKNLRIGKKIFDEGYTDINAVRSPDGRYIALLSNKGYDVGYTNLYILDTKNGKLKRLFKKSSEYARYTSTGASMPGDKYKQMRGNPYKNPLSIKGTPNDIFAKKAPIVSSRIQWFPNSKKIYYARTTSRAGGKQDVYTYDIVKEREKQITWHARVMDPALSPDGKTFAYVNNKGGIQNLVFVDASGRNTRFLTNFNDGTQLYNPVWSPDGKKIILGIMHEENRDIAIVNADAEPFDRYRKQTDTSFFADTLNFQEDLCIELLIGTKADEREPFLTHDGKQLYFSSDRTGIFNIYRMNLEDGQVEQITNVVGGAFAPSVDKRGKKLLYTGFEAANFSIFEMTIKDPMVVTIDSTEQRDFSVRFDDSYIFSSSPENGQYRLGEYKGRWHLWQLIPYISFQPAFITDTIGMSNFRTGFQLLTGELKGAVNFSASAYVAKKFDDQAGPSWGGSLASRLKPPAIEGENFTMAPYFETFIQYHNSRSENQNKPEYSTNDFTGKLPNVELSWLNNNFTTHFFQLAGHDDSLYAGAFLDDISGTFRYNHEFMTYGLSGFMNINKNHSFGLFYYRSKENISGGVYDNVRRLQVRVFKMEKDTSGVLIFTNDTKDIVADKTTNEETLKSLKQQEYIVEYKFPGYDMVDLYKNLNLYKDHTLGLRYQYMNARPSFSIPSRVSNFFINAMFFNTTCNIEYNWAASDSMFIVGGNKDSLIIGIDNNGKQMPLISGLNENKDYFSLNMGILERFPLPGNNLTCRPPKVNGMRHFITLNGFFGSLNRKLSDYAYNYPLKYRASQFLNGYPYSFTPIAIDLFSNTTVKLYAYDEIFDFYEMDSVIYAESIDGIGKDILEGNGVMYYSLEYTLEFLRGATIPGIGFTVNGLFFTPFIETAALWNSDWSDFDFKNVLPIIVKNNKLQLNESYLSDAGIRTDLNFTIFDTWRGSFSFTWTRRLSLDDAILEVKEDGTIVHLDKNRFKISIELY